MSRLTDARVTLAKEIVSRYPRAKSALVPLLHLAQEQDGHVTREAMVHIAELVGVTPAEVYGTASFYEMFRFEPIGRYLINVCGTLSCALMGANELIHHAEERLGVRVGGTTDDGMFTLARAECQAACTEAPCLQVNYRYRFRVTPADFDVLIDQLRVGAFTDEIPAHGTLATVRQEIPVERAVGARAPEDDRRAPAWMEGTS